MTYTFGTVVSKEFRDTLAARYPKIFENSNRIKFFWHILFNLHAQKVKYQGGSIIYNKEPSPVHYEWLRKSLLGERDNSFNTIQFLTEFQDSIDFPLNLTGYSVKYNLCRTFDPSVPDELIEMVRAEIKIPRTKRRNPVLFIDGRVPDPRKISKARKAAHTEHYGEIQSSIITKYFSEMNPTAYNRFYEHIESLIEMVEKQDITREKKDNYLFHLEALSVSLVPQYYENNPFERVWAKGYSLQNLKREFRSEILKGGIEADLVSCHLSIAAYDWNIPGLKSLLENGINFWKHVHIEMGIPFCETTKAAFKKGTYAIIYGGSDDVILTQMRLVAELSPEIENAFLSAPIIQEIKAAADKHREIAKKNKQIELADGTILKSRRAQGAKKAIEPQNLISWRAMSIERYIIESVFVVASKYPKDFRILSLEHDGFTFVVQDKSKEQMVWNRLSKAVREKGLEKGIKIDLERK